MSNTVIRIAYLSKICRDLKRSLFYGVKDISSELFGSKKNGQLRKDEFWVVTDVSMLVWSM